MPAAREDEGERPAKTYPNYINKEPTGDPLGTLPQGKSTVLGNPPGPKGTLAAAYGTPGTQTKIREFSSTARFPGNPPKTYNI